ncbi:AraC family transcriptional regulator [Alloalcanivorax xenomutans]|uniref:AraC family transcriptional regulator n=1 Tax=Alloalcanivorax xenomutans TaxID=1094342 RepID=UPI000BC70231|nr:helix-turn-helix domain-containing protein [Alloalcanivorax xenomutans]SOC26829.1 AraC family transcriptional regulator [Alloalcanivorax xenomutans]
MEAYFHSPGAPLSEHIEQIWWVRFTAPEYHLERVLPRGKMQLIFNLDDADLRVYDPTDITRVSRFRGPLISGVHDGYMVIDTAEQAHIMGVVFRPGGVPPILGCAAPEFRNVHVPLDDALGAPAMDLQMALWEADSPRRCFLLMEQALRRWLRPPPRTSVTANGALALMVREPGLRATGSLAEHCGISQRHLIRCFHDTVGVTPKQYARLLRFHHSLELLRHLPPLDLDQVALVCGYYDQAHFNRDFRDLAGITPGHYRRWSRPDIFHLPLLD